LRRLLGRRRGLRRARARADAARRRDRHHAAAGFRRAVPVEAQPGVDEEEGPAELSMEYRNLGRTGLKVSPLCLGTMMFGAWGNRDHDESIRIIHAALDAGINFVDTSNNSSNGESETIVGEALAGGKRENVVLATKVYAPMGDGPNQRGLSRKAIHEQVE